MDTSTAPEPVVPHRRQVEVLRLIARGMTNKAVAAVLHVAECTVKPHRNRLYRLVGAKNAAHAVAIGLVRGWLR